MAHCSTYFQVYLANSLKFWLLETFKTLHLKSYSVIVNTDSYYSWKCTFCIIGMKTIIYSPYSELTVQIAF